MKLTYKIFLTLLFSNVFIPVDGQINLQITPSATSGTAPLYVFFDATSSTGLGDSLDLVNSDFQWNFDVNNNDPNGNWESIKGMVAGHVFEEAGTYTVQCDLIAPDGTTDTKTVTITVSAFSGTTYYVSNSGSDGNDGLTTSTPWQTANYAFSQLGANERILFNRGETFTNIHYDFANLSGGKMIIGAYGTGNKPILSGLSGEDRMIQMDNIDDLTFMDVHVLSNTPGAESYNFDINSCTNILLLNTEFVGAAGIASVCLNTNLFGVFDSYYHDFGVMAIYTGNTDRFSMVGNTIDNLDGTAQPEHGVRVQGGEKQCLAHNTLTNLTNTKTAMTVRGDGQRHVMIYKNKMDRLLGVNPQNSSTVAAISDVVIEGNYVGQNTDYTNTTWGNSFNGINIEATNVAIRNNVIDGYHNGIAVLHDYNGVVSGSVDIYNNTLNWRAVSPISYTSGRLVWVRDVSFVKVKNNLITAPTIAEGSAINYSGTNTNISVQHNVIATTSAYTTNSLPGSEADANDISNYQIASSSTAVDAGVTGIPVFYDASNFSRIGLTPDVGAYEYQASLPVELVNFDANINNQKVELTWQTLSEINNEQFMIHRSDDATNWETIGSVAGNGNASERIDYEFVDENPPLGKLYYRLKQVDFDGGFEYSEIKSVEHTLQAINIYPNPTYDILNIDAAYPIDEIRVYNVLGEIVKGNTYNGFGKLDVNNLPTGTYYIEIHINNSVISRKIIRL